MMKMEGKCSQLTKQFWVIAAGLCVVGGLVVWRYSTIQLPHNQPTSQRYSYRDIGRRPPVPLTAAMPDPAPPVRLTAAMPGPAAPPRVDPVDNSRAKGILQLYQTRFNKSHPVGDPNNQSSIVTWWQAAAMIDWYIKAPVNFNCKHRERMGNWGVCQDEPYTIKPPCLVYSFGINWDWKFDDAMGKLGCEVHSFDPSMKTKDHQRNINVTFYNLGIGKANWDAYKPHADVYVKANDPTTWKVRTLKAIRQMLKHENRVIDVLKMDIEGHEWGVVDNLMETGVLPWVRQLALEWHLFPWQSKEEFVHYYQVNTRFREMGFRKYYNNPKGWVVNLDPKHFNNQGDQEYVNLFFDSSVTNKQ